MKTVVDGGIKYLPEENFDREDWEPGAWQHWTYAQVNIHTKERELIGIYVHTRDDLFKLCNQWNRRSALQPELMTWMYYAV